MAKAKKAKRRRGRPSNPQARRRATTRVGRRGEVEPVDQGSIRLRARKQWATGRDDLPLDGAAVLFGRELIDAQQFDRLGEITALLAQVARSWGVRGASVAGIWNAILAAGSRLPAHTVSATPAGADGARWRLVSLIRQLNGSRELVMELAEGRLPPIVDRAVHHRLTAGDLLALAALRADLDQLSGRR